MPRRLPQTLADYVVVAIAPTLIALMVGAMLFFLVELLYPADWHARLRWIFGWYVIAIVGIARISLEQGWAYASIFAAGLSAAVALVVPPASWPLLVVVWWATHQLTRDTTLIDETQDASGEGLWETAVGDLSRPRAAVPHPTIVPPKPGAARQDEQGMLHRREPPLAALGRSVGLWLGSEPPARPHAPGRWVIYFCLAAVPLFGLGGWLLPRATPSRWWAMRLLVVYTACGLGLLLSTSFLGLRRYLRQRQVVMPPEMTAVWLAAGGLAIAATLLVAAVLPRPSPQVSMLRLVELAALNVRRASPWGWGREGLPDDTTPDAATTPGQPDSADTPPADRPSTTAQPPAVQPQTSRRSETSGDSRSVGARTPLQNPSSELASKSSGRRDEPAADDAQATGRGRTGVGDATPQERKGEAASRRPARSPQGASTGRPARSAVDRSDYAESKDISSGENRNLVELSGTVLRVVGQGLAMLLRLAVTLGGFCLIAYVLWTYRAELAEAWQKLLEALAGLWGRPAHQDGRPSGPPVSEMAAPLPFTSFPDPFVTGAVARMPWRELVRYTFAALEAWAREQGCPRRADQTPQEFVAELLRAQKLPGQPLKTLSLWYSELAYGPRQKLQARPLPPLQALWQAMDAQRSTPAAAS